MRSAVNCHDEHDYADQSPGVIRLKPGRRNARAWRLAVDIAITAKGARITDRFKAYAEEKLDKVALLLPKATGISMKVTRHADPHASSTGGRVEITVRAPGAVIRAEAEGPDKYIAFDAAFHRVMERARRAHDRRTEHRGAKRTPLREATSGEFANLDVTPADAEILTAVRTGQIPTVDADSDESSEEWSPVVIREKRFPAKSMTTREAVDQMELVGHPFYLFVDAETDQCAVVYRRKGWSYGVLSLSDDVKEGEGEEP